ncbi:hypothetical protein JOEDIRT_111 [Mycobacterium phage JoeDirt]|uniref:Uncharacterized protein n=2 Tax=Bronvirus TaxID=1623278 RepID=G1BQN4_9CAUD|nr:nuclease [Mycobacterium phage JoeDirt]AEK07132.1 hypothetical protein JOEDIRT_111 [Mycobacterium phage JoeDirt]AEK07632.1 hypothetical protein UPIE_110 [Mycobacterium phage UPIE]AEZ50782.1 hypothetical protein [Mycobacterium phage Fezzik]
MSEVKSLYGTRSSRYWSEMPGKMDVLNLRMIFPSSSPEGIPDLQRCDWVPDFLGAWHMPRQRERAARENGALHFFLDDYRFENAFSSPERVVGRVLKVGGALEPNFSLYYDMPRAAKVWNTYRTRWCGAYWQSLGVKVIPTAVWARSDTFEYCFDGIPQGGPVAISTLGVRAEAEDIAIFNDGLRELVDRVEPSVILCYGKLRYVPDSVTLPEVREYPTFWDVRRNELKAANGAG